MTTILGIQLSNRVETAKEVQNILTEYGCCIKTRLGLHHTPKDGCANYGLILIELPEDNQCDELAEKLSAVSGAIVKSMVF
jgi:hypothetical protein